MFVELHMIQNFAPSNLNRDDASAPKDCIFGGSRRARISSQCQKRAIRTALRQGLVPEERLAVRTRRIAAALTDRLVAAGHERARAESVVRLALRDTCLEAGSDNRSKYLMFVGESELDAMARAIDANWQRLLETLQKALAGRSEVGRRAQTTGRQGLVSAGPELRAALERCLDGGKAVDLALFGRLVADLPASTINGASQIAHAISTHQVSPELDFFTAVDDLRPQGTAGAELVGTLQFNSACFYRYANLDLGQLGVNLHGDHDQVVSATEMFLRAAIAAVPTGKQATWAAHNPPSFVLVVVRETDLWSLANAFISPVRPKRDSSLVRESALALMDYWHRLARMYGDGGIGFAGLASVDDIVSADAVEGVAAHSGRVRVTTGIDDLLSLTGAAVVSAVGRALVAP